MASLSVVARTVPGMEFVILAAVLVAVVLLAVLIVVVHRSAAVLRGGGGLDEVERQRQLAVLGEASARALAGQSQQFLQLAETRYGALTDRTAQMLEGHSERIGEALASLADRLAALERERHEATGSLAAMVRELAAANRATRDETAQLRAALRDGRVRGAWGEVQLRRVLELSGMVRHVDFVEQSTTVGGDRTLRPDVVVHLPNGRCVVVDAKAPLDRYLEAHSTDDPDARRQLLAGHARAVASHVSALSSRRYNDHVDGAVDMVVAFLPGEPFLAAALDAEPALFETAAAKGVVLCTPTSLLMLLRAVALGWREHRAGEEAEEVRRLGAELHERIAVFLDSYAQVGRRIAQAAEAYNRSVGSAESRLVVTARRLADSGANSARTMPELAEVEVEVRDPRGEALPGPDPVAALCPTPFERDGEPGGEASPAGGARPGAAGSSAGEAVDRPVDHPW